MNNDDKERQIIRDAMERLLAGTPIRSDGKLTIKSLAAEADVKRWLLTHRHTDLQEEFRDKIRTCGSTPAATRALAASNNRLKQQLKQARDEMRQARDEMRQARDENNHYARVIQVLTVELEQLHAAAPGTTTTVTPIDHRTRHKRSTPPDHR